MAEVPILPWLTSRNSVAKPSMRFSNKGSSASGVTSRPVKPVPPVVMTTSIAGSAIQAFTWARIFSTSSVTIVRAATAWPARSMRSTSVAPDLSSASARVSDTVSTAIFKGMNWRDSSMPGIALELRARRKGVAGLHGAGLQAGLEPALALLRGAVGEGVRDGVALRLLLQPIVADRRRGLHRRLDVARLDQVPLLVGFGGPDAGEAVGLQLDAHLQAVRFGLARGSLLLLHLRQDAELVLHVMPDLVRDHVSLRELARARADIAAAEAPLEVAEERRIEIDLLVGRAIERTHGRLCHAALIGARRAGEHHQRRFAITLAALLEGLRPHHVRTAQHARDELAHVVARGAGLARLARLLLIGLPAAGEDLRAADQQARVDAERIADDAEHHDGADAEPAAAHPHRKAETTAATAVAAAILDVLAFGHVIETHLLPPRPRSILADRPVQVHSPFSKRLRAGLALSHPTREGRYGCQLANAKDHIFRALKPVFT